MPIAALHPRLIVDDPAESIDFYVAALGAVEQSRFAEPDGRIVNAELSVGDDRFTLTGSGGDLNRSPADLGGSPLLLAITTDDADAVGAAMVAAGADVVIPIDDGYYGKREGRIRDPFGHLWIVSQELEALDDNEIHRRLASS